jgi:tetratricopeptide (TPR) repeat protein
MRKGQLQAALELTNRFLEANPTNPVGWRLRGEIRFYEGEIIKAIDDLKKSKSFKDEAATRVVLAKAYLRASRFEDAVTELKNAIDSPGVPMEARLLLEETYKQLDRKEALGEFYAATINEFPSSVFWLNRAGLYALEMADYNKAAQLYSKSFELKRQEYGSVQAEQMRFDAQYASAFDGYLRSNILLAGLPNRTDWKPEKLDEVFEFAKQYLDTHYSPLAYLRMAQAKLLLGHKRTAVEYCQKAVNESEENEALASEVLLRMFLLLGPEEVSKYCLEKLKQDPDSIPANFTMFNLHKVNREYLKALPYIIKCIELTDPDNRKHLDYTVKKAEILTLAYQRSSDNKYLKMAIAEYKSLLEKMPNNTSVLNNLAYMLAEGDENIGDALKYAEKVYSLSPNDPGVLDTYGYVLYKNGKYTEALGHLNAALQYYGQNKLYIGWEVYEHLGLIKQALGDEFGAVMAYEQAKKVGGVSMSNKDLERINKALESLSSK